MRGALQDCREATSTRAPLNGWNPCYTGLCTAFISELCSPQRQLPCRVRASDNSSFGWEEYDGDVDELLDGKAAAASITAQHRVAFSTANLPTACGPATQPVVKSADAAADVVVLSDGSEGSDWNDDDFMMTLSDGAREYDATAMVSGPVMLGFSASRQL